MKLKMSEILKLYQVLKSIIDDRTMKINSLFKFRLLGIMKGIEQDVSNFEIIRNEKIKEYGKESEDGRFSIQQNDKDALEKFSSDLSSILEETVDVNISKLKPVDIFEKGVPAEYLLGLYPIIEEE